MTLLNDNDRQQWDTQPPRRGFWTFGILGLTALAFILYVKFFTVHERPKQAEAAINLNRGPQRAITPPPEPVVESLPPPKPQAVSPPRPAPLRQHSH